MRTQLELTDETVSKAIRRTKRRRWLVAGVIGMLALVLAGIGVAQVVELPIATGAVGESCAEWVGGESCASNLCINVGVFGAVCSRYCTTDAECTLSGWKCRSQVQGNGEKVGYCAPLRILANP